MRLVRDEPGNCSGQRLPGFELAKALATEFPSIAEYGDLIGTSVKDLLRCSKGSDSESERVVHRAIDFYKNLAASQPTAVGFKQELARQYAYLAARARDNGKPREAVDAFRNARDQCVQFYGLASPNEEMAWRLVDVSLDLGNLLRTNNQREKADQVYIDSIQLYRGALAQLGESAVAGNQREHSEDREPDRRESPRSHPVVKA